MSSVPPGIPPGGSPYSPPPGQPPNSPPGYGPPQYPPPSYPPPSYPPPPLYGGMPPAAPPPKGNRGLLLGIGGGVVAAIVVLGVALLFLRPTGGPTTATAAPSPPGIVATATAVAIAATPTATTAGVIVDLATATRPPPTLTRPPTTPTRPPTTPTVAAQTTWMDPDGFIGLKFPSDWKQGRDATAPSNLLELDGPDTYMALNIEDPQQGTLAEEIAIITRNQASSQKFNYTDQQTQDMTIGGEPAKRMTFTYTDKADAKKVYGGVWWVVNHEGRQYGIVAGPVGASRTTVDAVVASVTFPPARLNTWIDADKSVRLRYPKEWTATRDASAKDNVLKLSGSNNEIAIFVNILTPGTTTIEQAFKTIRDGGSDDGTTNRTYDPVTDTKVGGQPAKSMAYRYTQKANPNLTPGVATIWIVDYKGKRYEFFCSNMATHRPEIEALIATVVFLK